MTPPGEPGPSARGDGGDSGEEGYWEGEGAGGGGSDASGGAPVQPLRESPRALLLVVAIFVVILGIPAGLAVASGRWDVALWILGGFVLLVVATARVFRAAIAMQRGEA